MSDRSSGFGWRVQLVFLTCVRGLVQAAVSLLAGLPLLMVSLVAIGLLPLGVGVFVAPRALLTVRRLANRQRCWAREWSGVTIPIPYRPAPAGTEAGTGAGTGTGTGADLIGRLRRCRWLLTDPATWRDLLWVLLNVPFGLVVGVLSLVSIPLGALMLLTGATVDPRVLRGHALFTRLLLAPNRQVLAQRVRHLTESRADVVDASAAELRRIERDLHDGAQGRLVSLGMNIGLAEQLVKDDPEMALELLAEARLSSGTALSELRALVRGIHPPVLAERGLDGGIRAIALTLPLPVDVRIDLEGRPRAPVESAAYFAIAESLANVVKHSAASRAWIDIHYRRGRLLMIVGDDGVGGADAGNGSGLPGIERRLAAFDGTIAVTSPPGGPTVVTMELPCELLSARTLPSCGTD